MQRARSAVKPDSTQRTRRRREREHREHRKEILVAARDVFSRRGYQAATLDEIADRAGFAKGTLYNYFRGKEDLFQHMTQIFLDDMRLLAVSIARERGTSREKFHRFACGMMEYYRTNEDFLRIATLEMGRLQLREEHRLRALLQSVREIATTLGRTLETDIAAGRVVADDPLELAQVFIALVHNRTMRRSIEHGGLRAMEARKDADFLTRLFFDGIVLQ